MATQAAPIYSTDQKVISNVISPLTGQFLSYQQRDRWIDGSLMRDEVCDDVFWVKSVVNGKYYELAGQEGRLNLGLMLQNGGVDNLPKWSNLLAALSHATGNWRTPLDIPSRLYYNSGTIDMSNVKIEVNNNGLHTFPPGCTGWQIRKYYANNVVLNNPRLMALGQLTGDQRDGMVANNDPSYLQYLNQVGYDMSMWVFGRKPSGSTLGDYLTSKPAGTLVKSLRPSDYKYHGIYSTDVVHGDGCGFIGYFSGHGIYNNGLNLQQKGDYDAPDGYNTSLSTWQRCVVRACGGYQVVTSGVDGNQITLLMMDLREGGLAAGHFASQSGTITAFNHEAENATGGYQFMERSDPLGMGNYSEVNESVSNYYLGGNHNGPLNKPAYGGGMIMRGPKVNAIQVNDINYIRAQQTSDFNQGGATSRIEEIKPLQGGGRINSRQNLIGPGVTHRGMSQHLEAGEPSVGGRQSMKLPAVDIADEGTIPYNETTKVLRFQGRAQVQVNNFLPPSGERWRVGDRLLIREGQVRDNQINEWKCIFGGTYGETFTQATTTSQLPSGITAVYDKVQHIKLSSPSAFFRLGDAVVFPGSTPGIVGVEYAVDRGDMTLTGFSISQPLSGTAVGSTVALDLPRARFQAVGAGRGTLAQRPHKQATDANGVPTEARTNLTLTPDDIGWLYDLVPDDGNLDNVVTQRWTGSKFKTITTS